MRRILCFAVFLLSGAAAWSQVVPFQEIPVPIQGGDVIPPLSPGDSPFMITIFSPGTGVGYDGQDAEPNGLTNFRGLVAMGYTSGLATDQSGVQYQVITDIRVFKGDFVGAQPTFSAGGSTSAAGHGTFVEI